MAIEWYVQIDGTEYGPETAEQLRSMAKSGRLARTSLVRKGTTGDWVPADRIKGLFDGTGESIPTLNKQSARPQPSVIRG